MGPGSQQIALSSKLPPGNWHYSVTVNDGSGKAVAVNTFTSGVVSGVDFVNGALMLKIGSALVSTNDLVEIKP